MILQSNLASTNFPLLTFIPLPIHLPGLAVPHFFTQYPIDHADPCHKHLQNIGSSWYEDGE